MTVSFSKGREIFEKLAYQKSVSAASPTSSAPKREPGGPKRDRPDTQYYKGFASSNYAQQSSPLREATQQALQGKRPPPPIPTRGGGSGIAGQPTPSDHATKMQHHRSEPYTAQSSSELHHPRPFSTPPDVSSVDHIPGSAGPPPAAIPRKKLSMREEVFNELICTERIYNRHLNVIVDVRRPFSFLFTRKKDVTNFFSFLPS